MTGEGRPARLLLPPLTLRGGLALLRDPAPGDPRRAVDRAGLLIVLVTAPANLLAVVVECLLLIVAIPDDAHATRELWLQNAVLILVVFAVAGSVMLFYALRLWTRFRSWAGQDGVLGEQERALALRVPTLTMRIWAIAWVAAAILFALFNLRESTFLGVRALVASLLVGQAMAAFAYLVAERAVRPALAHLLRVGEVEDAALPGIERRQLLGWTSTAGSAFLTFVLVGAGTVLGYGRFTTERLALTLVLVGLAGLGFGFVVQWLAVRSATDPIRTVRDGLDQLRAGSFDARIDVYDGAEVGRLQAGFNRMAEALQERDRVHDLFGRQVGAEVARAALDADVRLGGETRDVCALFVEALAATSRSPARRPDEVIGLLNRFFAVVVETVGAHEGWVNKFQGDAALVVFGAPADQPDAPDRALRAARELGARIAAELPDVHAAIGVSGGRAVAGYIGTQERFEYTVIGDPINEAARLCEIAAAVPGCVAASGRLVDRATAAEQARWRLDHRERLRGRGERTAVMVPRG
ncbi:adenylate/guanylate cyclase domain-containing protein [Patulibacter medicamentivorans]|uniref:adenylate/guanylate cyclase domain-containing protein n=1 Tax=Patulibacter medicamentivorans TaxID=1097667 RepID=UPI0002F40330|nr:adenylate/guanylate cyclase domain-containing protein [Patulibacter medicamentivorans]